MTQRVSFDGVAASGQPGYSGVSAVAAPHANITPEVVDRAVEETFSEAQVSPDVARVVRGLMSADAYSPVAQAYYQGKVLDAVWSTKAGLSKRDLEVPYALTDAQAAALNSYAPDFSLRMTAKESHDHPVAAACRSVDRALVDSRLPPGVQVSHVGAALVPLVLSGKLGHGHHACVPVVDPKDPVRHVLTGLRARKLAGDATRSLQTRDSAQGMLDRRVAYLCDRKVQDCSFQSPVLTAVHVYDVPMEDWAGIMDKKGAMLLEGCVLFPRDLFKEEAGEMKSVGARYEVDARRGRFRMGFIDSPSWWYEHDLEAYLKYGVDQVLSAGGATYSYKIVERRGDTIFFRILRVSRSTQPDFRQTFRVPGIEMVRVNGFPIGRRPSSWVGHSRSTYLFPRALWVDMLGHAKGMVERGVLDHERLFNYYRTVAPRQSINAVVVSGGSVVDKLSDLLPLIVHVALFAFLEVRKAQVESQHAVEAVMRERAREKEWTMWKVLAAFGDSLMGAAKVFVYPLAWLSKVVNRGMDALHELALYDWAVEPVVQVVSARLVLPVLQGDESLVASFDQAFSHAAPADMARAAMADSGTAAMLLDQIGHVLPSKVKMRLEGSVARSEAPPSAGATTSESVSVAAPEIVTLESTSTTVEGDTSVGTDVGEATVSGEEIARRRLSIKEAILECDAEAKKSEAACADHYRDLMVGGAPNKRKMVARKESCFNPDFWWVTGGVIASSFSGLPVDGFIHAAVFVPAPVNGSRLLTVEEETFKGLSQGEYVERVHHRVASGDFEGWVYTNDSLLIHNGPALSAAMAAALELPLDFKVVLNQGPPGCGKTRSIVKAARSDDYVLVPVRKAARDTAERLLAHDPTLVELSRERCRTIDSYLVNRDRNKRLKAAKAARLLADEAFMAREGRWLAAAGHLGVSVVEAYGDREQIPHVPRAECPKAYVRMLFSEMKETWVSYRCPAQLVACWGYVYGWRVRSASRVDGIVRHVGSSRGLQVPKGCVMMGMYQADKKLLKERYAQCGVDFKVMTVHESEGNTYEHVWLHRFDLRRRSDRFSLYDQVPYALVAMSRSTKSFIYIAPRLGDVVEKMVDLGKDGRRVAAAACVETAGTAVEKI